jgi:DNA-binding LacI/PurR family transcriptional regulator
VSIDSKKSSPLYQQIVDDIKTQIRSGVLRTDESVGSHKELSENYGVSLITVKKALNELINLKYLYSRVGKGTYVATHSEEIDFSADITIGLVLRDLNSPFFARIVESVEKYASEIGCNLLISTSSNSRDKENQQIEKYLKLGVSGLILTSVKNDTHASHQLRKLHNENFPYVVVAYSEDQDINYIGVDHEQGAFIATEHLIKLGYKHLGYINSENGYKLGEVRKKGFLRALEHNGQIFNEDFHYRLVQRGGWRDYESGYDIAKYFINQANRPDAIFAYNDLAALGFEKGVLENGLSVPEDVAIVGFDNIKRGVVAPVPLTTIHQPANEVGRLAIKMIFKKIRGEVVKHRIILKPELVIRESCGAKAKELKSEKKFQKISELIY